jgi:hypothetical protein
VHDQTKNGLKSTAALLFLILLGAVLARPVFVASDKEPAGLPSVGRKSPTADKKKPKPKTTKPKPTPTPTETEEPVPTNIELADRYPTACLDRVQPATGTGLIAAYRYGRGGAPNGVDVASPTGSRAGSTAMAAPVSWSPSGNLLLGRTGDLSTPSGKRAGTAFGVREDMPMMWSPIADCVVGAGRDGLIVGVAGREPVTILRGRVGGLHPFSFSSDGTKIFFSSGSDDHVLDLSRHELTTGRPSKSRDICDRFDTACSPDGRYLAAIRQGRLVLLSRSGSFIRNIATDSGYEDAYPIWGPPRTGIVFIRTKVGDAEAPAEIWFVAEGGVPRSTGLTLPPPSAGIQPGQWRSFFNWTAAERPLAPIPVFGD